MLLIIENNTFRHWCWTAERCFLYSPPSSPPSGDGSDFLNQVPRDSPAFWQHPCFLLCKENKGQFEVWCLMATWVCVWVETLTSDNWCYSELVLYNLSVCSVGSPASTSSSYSRLPVLWSNYCVMFCIDACDLQELQRHSGLLSFLQQQPGSPLRSVLGILLRPVLVWRRWVDVQPSNCDSNLSVFPGKLNKFCR